MDLLNTHLESTADHAEERMRQLEKCLDIMTKRPEDRTVILGGDLNMRDKEVTSVGGLPAGTRDVWEQLGSRPEVINRNSDPSQMLINLFLFSSNGPGT